jgi:hypothetical protein
VREFPTKEIGMTINGMGRRAAGSGNIAAAEKAHHTGSVEGDVQGNVARNR